MTTPNYDDLFNAEIAKEYIRIKARDQVLQLSRNEEAAGFAAEFESKMDLAFRVGLGFTEWCGHKIKCERGSSTSSAKVWPGSGSAATPG